MFVFMLQVPCSFHIMFHVLLKKVLQVKKPKIKKPNFPVLNEVNTATVQTPRYQNKTNLLAIQPFHEK